GLSRARGAAAEAPAVRPDAKLGGTAHLPCAPTLVVERWGASSSGPRRGVVETAPTGAGEAVSEVQRGPAAGRLPGLGARGHRVLDRKSTRLNSSHVKISYAVFCLKKKKKKKNTN